MDIVHSYEIGKVREMLSPSRESQLKSSNTPQKRFQKRFQKTLGIITPQDSNSVLWVKQPQSSMQSWSWVAGFLTFIVIFSVDKLRSHLREAHWLLYLTWRLTRLAELAKCFLHFGASLPYVHTMKPTGKRSSASKSQRRFCRT